MVNVKGRIVRTRVLAALRDSSTPLSGESLGRHLGISRVAVYNHILALKEDGYPVESGRRGYSLVDDTEDRLTPWEFKEDEKVEAVATTESTMDLARRLAEVRAGEVFTVVAEHQTEGRGRRGRSWLSPAGGLWATHVLRPGGSAIEAQRWVISAAVALARILRERYALEVRTKWPNDVLVGDKKVAGILAEYRAVGDRFAWLALGMGVNANNDAPVPSAQGLASAVGRPVDRRELLRGWLGHMKKVGEEEDRGLGLWWRLSADRGAQRRIRTTSHGVVKGRVAGVDGLGRIRLSRTGSPAIRLAPGEYIETIQGERVG